jgi:hypothetical protein
MPACTMGYWMLNNLQIEFSIIFSENKYLKNGY